MASPDQEIKLKISADAAQAVQGLINTEARLHDLNLTLSVAEQESSRLKTEFDAVTKKTDSLQIQTALAKRELQNLAEQGLSKNHAEYRALAGEIQNMEAALKRSVAESKSTEKAYGAAAKEVQKLTSQVDKTQQSLTRQEAALKQAGIDTQHLAAEYQRLKTAAEAAASLNIARGILDVKPHQAVEAEIQKVRRAFQTLKESGVLSNAEIAQAALKAEEKIRALKQSTNGWMESLAQAKGAFLQAGVAAGGLTAAAQQAIQFESALADVAKTTGLSGAELSNLGTRLKDLSTELPISADGLAQIAAAGGSLGIANDQIEAFVRLAATMATAFDLPVEQAGEAVAALTNNFGLSIAEVRKLGDTINVLGNQTAAREKDIVDALSRIGGSARQFGLSAEQAAALADAMLALKMPTEVASTAINAMLGKLQTIRIGSAEAKLGLSQLGISADQLAADIQANPSAALTRFLHTLQQVDAQSRAEILSRLFGQEHADEIARLVGGLGNYDKAMQLAGQSAASAGAMQKEFETRAATAENKLQLMKNTVEAAAIDLGTVFLPIIKDVADGVRTATRAVAEFEQAFPGIAAAAATLATVAAAAGALRIGFLALRLPIVEAGATVAAMAKTSAQALPEAIAAVGKLRTAFAGLSAFLIGWDIGTWARQKFEIVYQSGIALAAGLERVAETIRYAWERLSNVFASDLIKQEIIDRHTRNLQQIDDINADLFNNWKLQTDQQGAQTDGLTEKQGKLGAAGQAADEQIAAGAAAAAAGQGEMNREIEAAVGALEQLKTQVESHTKILESESQQRRELLEQQVANAKAAGDETTALRLLGELKQTEILDSGRLVQAKQQEANVAEALARTKQQAADAAQGLNQKLNDEAAASKTAAAAAREAATAAEVQHQALLKLPLVLGEIRTEQALTTAEIAKFKEAAATAIANAHAQEAAYADGKISLQQLALAQAEAAGKLETYTQALKTHIEQINTKAQAEQRAAGLTQQAIQTQIAEKQAALASAKARGDETEAIRLGLQIKQLEAKQAAATAAAKQQEAVTARELSEAIEEQAKADGTLTAAEQASIQAAQDSATAKELEARASKANADSKQTEADAARKEANSKKTSKEATDQATDSQDKLNQSQSDSVQILTAGQKALAAYTEAVNVYGNLDLGLKIANDSIAQKAHLEALKASLDAAANSGQGLGDAMREAGLSSDLSGVSIDDLRQRFEWLDDADLSNLLSSVNSVRSAVQSLRDSTASTLSTLQDELDSLTGNEQAKTERKYLTDKADLDAAYQKAVNARDAQSQSSALEAIKLLEEIHRRKMAAFDEEAKAKQQAEETPSRPSDQPHTAPIRTDESQPASARPSPTATIRLELALPGGQVIPAQVDNRFENDLLDLTRTRRSAV